MTGLRRGRRGGVARSWKSLIRLRQSTMERTGERAVVWRRTSTAKEREEREWTSGDRRPVQCRRERRG
jgi:hypothetical protein